MILGLRKFRRLPAWRWWMRWIRCVHYLNFYPEQRNLDYFGYEEVANITMWMRAFYSKEHKILLVYEWDEV